MRWFTNLSRRVVSLDSRERDGGTHDSYRPMLSPSFDEADPATPSASLAFHSLANSAILAPELISTTSLGYRLWEKDGMVCEDMVDEVMRRSAGSSEGVDARRDRSAYVNSSESVCGA